VAIHLGETTIGIVAFEVDGSPTVETSGPASDQVERIASLAAEGQILMTRGAFDLVREGEATLGLGGGGSAEIRWIAHGEFVFRQETQPRAIFEVGVEGEAPFSPPSDSPVARKLLGGHSIPGWRPALGQAVPLRQNWQLEKRLGTGGFGEVWLTRHRKTSKQRVFKFCFEARLLHALQREITVFRLLKEELGDRADIAAILDWNLDTPPYFIESEYTEGGSLLEWAQRKGGIANIDDSTRLEIVAQVAEALAAAHSVGVLHKDVKPGNILIQESSEGGIQARLCDFGIAQVTDRDRLEAAGITAAGIKTARTTTSLLPTGGTALYQAPELVEGKRPSTQADIYALGVTLYQLVTADLHRALGPGWQRDISDPLLRQDLSEAVDFEPARRLRDAGQLAVRLRSLKSRRDEAAAELRSREDLERRLAVLDLLRKRRRLILVALCVALVFAFSMGILARRVATQKAIAETVANRARDVARVAVASAWMSKDPTLAALSLLEVKNPEGTPLAFTKSHEALNRGIAWKELRVSGALEGVYWSPNERSLITTYRDSMTGEMVIWDFAGTGETRLISGHGAPVSAAAWSPDGRLLISAGRDATMVRWDTSNWQPTELRSGHTGRIWSLQWSPDGERFITASEDGTVRVFLAGGEEPAQVLGDHGSNVVGSAFSPDGRLIAAASFDGNVRLWEVERPGPARVLWGHEDFVFGVSFSPDGGSVLSFSADRTIRIWPLDGGGETIILRGHESTVGFAQFSPNGRQIVSSSYDGTVRLWEVDGSREPVIFTGHDAAVRGVEFSADGQTILSASEDGSARLWNVESGKSLQILLGHNGFVGQAKFNPTKRAVATVGSDGLARLWPVACYRRALPIGRHDGLVYSARYSPDGELILTTSADGTARIWKADGSGQVAVFHHATTVYDGDWSPDGSRIVTAARDDTARIWSVAEGTVVSNLPHPNTVHRASFDRQGEDLLTIGEVIGLRIWSSESEESRFLGELPGCDGAAFSSLGDRIVVTCMDGRTRLLDRATGRYLRTLRGHEASINDASFSPDGERILTASEDGTVRIWPVDRGETSSVLLAGHLGPVSSATFSSNGDLVVTGSWDGTTRMWRADGEGESVILAAREEPVSAVTISPDGKYVATATQSGSITRREVSGIDIMEQIRASTKICLTPKFRSTILGEYPEEALANFEACERSHGREPRAARTKNGV